MKFRSDIDIDFADRDAVLRLIRHVPATIADHADQEWSKVDPDFRDLVRDLAVISWDPARVRRHNTGVYVTKIPRDPLTGTASLDYREAEDRGYVKLDLLNVSVYQLVQDERHLEELMARTPPWHRLLEPDFCRRVIHIGNHYDVVSRLKPDSIERMAMVLAIIRPAKRYLLDRDWKDIEQEIWLPPADQGYYFKKSNAVSYSHLVAVHINLLDLAD